ncbi:MAG TPA: M20/M25/M40 family metallo-hydrolase [Rhizomicrobium sp.]|nr:M20/M25/M40 family metallo-hydrolase [Rhizomicrobium sp.]
MTAVWRIWRLAGLAVAVWFLPGVPLPVPLGVDAPAGQFSAARARNALMRLEDGEKPHPAGSAENSAVHQRLAAELARLGVQSETLKGMSCRSGGRGITCANVGDVVAEAVPGSGKAILLMAHMDSVLAGPGVGDDMSGVATILETIRALKASGNNNHPVMALFTDGEEFGLLGAELFLRDPARRSKVGVVVNVEARGTRGPSYLFQTSPGDAKLIDIYAASVPHPATSSLYGEIYRYLPNDTDLTPFLRQGLQGYNFAFIGNVAAYHTGLDKAGNLDPASLQSQGDNVLELLRGLERGGDLPSERGDAIYFDVLGRWLPRLPQSIALPLATLAFVIIGILGQRRERKGRVAAALMPFLLLLGCAAVGFVLAGIARLISGESNPSFAHPLALRLSLAAGCWFVALLASRRAGPNASWLWLSGLGIVTAVFAPGLSPYFIFPSLVAALLFVPTIGFGRGLALFLSALAAMLVWIGFAAQGEAIMGLQAHLLFTLPVAFGLMSLLPLMRTEEISPGAWRGSLIFSFLFALATAVAAGFLPAYSPDKPERLNLRYVEKDGNAWVLADPVIRLPQSLRATADFSEKPELVEVARGYSALAGASQFPAPYAGVSRRGNTVTLELYGARTADGMSLIVPGGLRSVTVAGLKMPAPPGQVILTCATPDCARAPVALEFSGSVPGRILLVEQHYGLPAKLDAIERARPSWAKPSQMGDMTAIAEDLMVPGGF